ncbi:RHS repeat domain-containing protein [Rhizobium jaguaris]|uniref:RHS repeat domain-containing protein n=1 Tax=Rhizobium jaguaris TaxID=1312183 RepID=UPI001FDFEAD0|nr:hypothetical protein [Rhizobium jaguaris]
MSNHSSDLGAFQLTYLGQTAQVTVRQLLPATSSLKTTWSYLDNAHDRRLSGIANTGLTTSQFTNFTFETTPENFITGITQESDASVPEPDPVAQTVSFNNLNEITQISGQAYNYDAEGNLLSDGDRTYSWDVENRLVGVTYASQPGKRTKFTYDGFGRRVETDDASVGGGSAAISKYVWCGSKLCQARDASYAVTRSYLDEGEYKVGATDPSLYYGIDQIGSVRRVYESTTSAPTSDFDPSGVAVQADAIPTDFGYAGMIEKSEEVGLNLSQYRGYDASTGRWLSRDPLTDSTVQMIGQSIDNAVSISSLSPFSFTKVGALSEADFLLRGGSLASEVNPYQYANARPTIEIDQSGLNPFTPDQSAVVDLAKGAQRGGLSITDAQTLLGWAQEYGLPCRGPEIHPNRPFNILHIHVGPINHIPVN